MSKDITTGAYIQIIEVQRATIDNLMAIVDSQDQLIQAFLRHDVVTPKTAKSNK
jgi:hypothetical protein